MIVVCPQCAKEYRVDPAELPPAKSSQYKNLGKGWWLSCRYCFKEWWFHAPKGFSWYEGGVPPEQYAKTVVKKSSRFEDKTDLTALQVNRPSTAETDYYHHQNMMLEEYTPYAERPEDVMELQELRSKKPLKIFLFILFVLSCSVLGFFLKPFWMEDTKSYVNQTVALTPPKNQKDILALKITDVQYDVVEKQDKKQIVIRGKIHNLKPESVPIPKLRMNIWGPCKPDSLASQMKVADEKIPHCLVKSWDESNDNGTIKADSFVQFESKGFVLIDAAVQRVEVTLIN
jgi:hypothetical protein